MVFQRARSEEQRELRRQAILDAAAAMLEEMPVRDVSLNELSRRVGLAKSNVLRYFETREAVLLELLNHALRQWLVELTGELAEGIDPGLPVSERAWLLVDLLSRSLAGKPVLCGLIGAQGSVLEQNVSVAVIEKHKRDTYESLDAATTLIVDRVPELGDGARAYTLQVLVLAGALAAYVPPPQSVLAVYVAEPSLVVLPTTLEDALRLAVEMTTFGALPRL